MRFSQGILVAATLTSYAVAQTTTAAPSLSTASATANSTSRTTPITQTVQVGVQHAFVPDTINAIVGDTIRFEFNPTNHSVVKADFKDPCVPFEYHRRDEQTFYSGQKLSKAGDEKPVWNLKVLDLNPTFFYCSAPESCTKWKMIGVINPNSTWSLENQLLFFANTTKFQLSPGEPYPEESPSTTTTSKSGSTRTATSSPTASTSNDTNNSGGGSSGLSTGAIAGIAIGGAAVLVLAAGLVWWCGRRGGIEQGYRRSATMPPPPSAPSMRDGYDRGPKSPGLQSSIHDVSTPHDTLRSTSPGQWSNWQPGNNNRQSHMTDPITPHSGAYGSDHSPLPGHDHRNTNGTYYDPYGNDRMNSGDQTHLSLPPRASQQPSELDGMHYHDHRQ